MAPAAGPGLTTRGGASTPTQPCAGQAQCLPLRLLVQAQEEVGLSSSINSDLAVAWLLPIFYRTLSGGEGEQT